MDIDSPPHGAGEGERADFAQRFWKAPSSIRHALSDLTPDNIPDEQFRLLADNIPTLCWMANGDGYIVWYNRRWHEYCGTIPEEMEGWGWQKVHDPDLLPEVMARWTASVATGEPFEMTFPLRGADGLFRPFLTRIQPVRDASGRVSRWFGVNTEISGQVRAEAGLARREAHLAAVFEQSAAGMSEADGTGHFLRVNDRFCAITGRSREELLGLRMHDITHPDDLVGNAPLFQHSIETGRPFEIEKRYVRPDGSAVWVHNSVTILRDTSGRLINTVCVTVDITQRKRAEEHQRLLVNELDHRVKNTLAIIQGIAQQSFRGPMCLADARTAFEGRLKALATTHDLLTRRNWKAAGIYQVIVDTIEALGSSGEQVVVAGPDLLLPPKTAVALAMAVHELATNALKYGALSVDQGRVEVRWDGEGGRLRLVWRERGGPEVTLPARRGFGTRMIEQGLAVELDGTVRIDFAQDGLVCLVEAPLPELAA